MQAVVRKLKLPGEFRAPSHGDMTYDATTGNVHAYDPENRILGAAGFTYTYDVRLANTYNSEIRRLGTQRLAAS